MSRAEKQRRRIRRKARGRQSPQNQWALAGNERAPRGIVFLNYDVTAEKLVVPAEADPGLDRMSDDDHRTLYKQLIEDPPIAIERLKSLLEDFPDSRTLRNWLSVAYSSAGDNGGAEREARVLYERHPDYLFAKLTVAQFCLQRGDIAEFEAIFEKKFDLKLMYPERDLFHISEYLGLARLMVEYYLRIKQHSAAQISFNMMEEIAPDHPLTEQARIVMVGSVLLRSIKGLARDVLRKATLR